MAADTMDMFSDTKHFGMMKVRKGTRSLYGFAGAVREMPQVFEWLDRRENNIDHPNSWPKDDVENCDKFDAILVIEGDSHGENGHPRSDPTIYRIAIGGICIQYTDMPQFIAIGTGAPFALGAMHAGASAPQAVAASIRYDLCSGGKVNAIQCEKGKGGHEHA